MAHTRPAALFAVLALGLGFPAAACAAEALPVVTLQIGTQKVAAEVAVTEESRVRGLMFRKKPLAENGGMLFIFDTAGFHSMWMKNTYIPLSVAFIDDAGVVLNIADMAPETTNTHTAAGFARYALEMNQGWFAKRGIKAGAKVEGLAAAPRPR
ncbi:MAG: DUF192 domain-containing protein [Burkholderiales bacterium]|nr:DUF192 domain-containing protein [Burkholderiales bacterium]